MSRPIVEISGLGVTVRDHKRDVAIIEDLSLAINEGEVLALVGESGCGKSMTALAIMRLVPKALKITPGSEILFEGTPLLKASVPEMRQMRGSAISMIFQDPMSSLNPVVSVGDQVAEAIRLHDPDTNPDAARKMTVELFERTGIPEAEARYDVFPHQLSGGLKQRVMIAMALVLRPRLLIADEPTTALDVTVQAQIIELLRELQREFSTSILLITHDLGVVNELADRVAVMYAGRIAETGTRHEILKSPQHPYTQGLLASIPSVNRRGHTLNEIPGVVPPPGTGPMGCRFQTRCDRVMEPCADVRPPCVEISPTQKAWCHALGKEGRDA